jgi:hypothetical protein
MIFASTDRVACRSGVSISDRRLLPRFGTNVLATPPVHLYFIVSICSYRFMVSVDSTSKKNKRKENIARYRS